MDVLSEDDGGLAELVVPNVEVARLGSATEE